MEATEVVEVTMEVRGLIYSKPDGIQMEAAKIYVINPCKKAVNVLFMNWISKSANKSKFFFLSTKLSIQIC